MSLPESEPQWLLFGTEKPGAYKLLMYTPLVLKFAIGIDLATDSDVGAIVNHIELEELK